MGFMLTGSPGSPEECKSERKSSSGPDLSQALHSFTDGTTTATGNTPHTDKSLASHHTHTSGLVLSGAPLVIGGGQRRTGRTLPPGLVLLLHHAVGEGDEVALQDDQPLAQSPRRQGALSRLSGQFLLVVHQHEETILQLSFI